MNKLAPQVVHITTWHVVSLESFKKQEGEAKDELNLALQEPSVSM